MSVRFEWAGPSPAIAARHLLARPVEAFQRGALAVANARAREAAWTVELGPDLFFDANGLSLLARALDGVDAAEAAFVLDPGESARREYYSLTPDLTIPAIARRRAAAPGAQRAIVRVALPARTYPIPFPRAMYGPREVSVPSALLMAARTPFDPLFASQIALLGEIERRVRTSPSAILRGVVARRPGHAAAQRAALAFRAIDRTADVHPTAVVEGSIVEAGARIGAHCVVRFSIVGPGARLHDGAKVEQSVVGRNTWLMHDLVLYRSVAEDDVFLIHGPYQFSLFQHASAAFATILMDYRPDGKPIQVETTAGRRAYEGLFLGAVYEEGSKTLGGSSIAPGRVVPRDTWLGQDPAAIHLLASRELALRTVLPPQATRAKA